MPDKDDKGHEIDNSEKVHETSERDTAYLSVALDFRDTGHISPDHVQHIFGEIVEKPQNKDQRSRATDNVRTYLLKESGIPEELLDYALNKYIRVERRRRIL